jgi:ribosome-associated protein
MTGESTPALRSGDPLGVRVNADVVIPLSELEVKATRSGGAGGQHVNTSSTRVEVMWNARLSRALDSSQRDRVMASLTSRVDSTGCVRVVASDTRSQRQNRELALHRLAALVRGALIIKKARKRTRPHAGAVEKRLAEKKQLSAKKRNRRLPPDN